MKVNVIGAGLAGCEAAYQLAKRGIEVSLYEMKPQKKSPAHHTDGFAELVCSNSLRSNMLHNAVGLLKEEMRRLDSLIMEAADACQVPAGGALAVDRVAFSRYITQKLEQMERINICHEEVREIEALEGITIVATGPLSSEGIEPSIGKITGRDALHFFDAAAPIVERSSMDESKAFFASRYDRGGDDYLNCPMNEQEYQTFYQALITAKTVVLKDFENQSVFEGCMPVEVMAQRGPMTLLFGPLKPKGILDPRTGKEPYAVVQLRKEDAQATLFNLVGFQTHLTFPEQRRVFSLIPGLENAQFVRYGVMHRNTYLNSPGLLDRTYQVKKQPHIYFAGQMTGVEGYVESASSGLVAGISAFCQIKGVEPPDFTTATAIGALAHYVKEGLAGDFQPMNVNFGIMDPLEKRVKNKVQKNTQIAQRALTRLEQIICQHSEIF